MSKYSFENMPKSTLKKEPSKLPSDWTWYKWGDLITSYEQGIVRSNAELYENGNIAYLKMNNLTESGDCNFNKVVYSDFTEEEVKKYKLNYGDFLINVRNSKELVGKTAIIWDLPKTFVYNHMLVRIEHIEKVLNKYINALFNVSYMKRVIDRLKKGTTTVIALYKEDLYNIPIALAPKEQIIRITDLYERICLKIELNNKINEELEKFAKTLYDYWFVQFDFPDENNRPLISRIFAQISNLFRLAVQYA